MLNPRKAALERFRDALAQPDAFLVGAAVGAGIAARAAERGGADFLIALNAGRFRMMGVSSLASMLPLRDSNQLVLDFGLTEIVNQTSLPTIFGATSRGDRGQGETLVKRIVQHGYAGICNFPTCIHYSEAFQQVLERAGLGFTREIEIVRCGQELGLAGIVYVNSVNQVRQAAQAGADIVCMNFGWNTGGTTGVVASLTLADVAAKTHEFVRTARSWNPDILCLLEGGPIETAEDLFEICRNARVDGYIGGSTLDLIPMGDSVAETTTEFKMARMLRGRIESLEKRLASFQVNRTLVGASPQMLEVAEQASRFAGDRELVMIYGEPGTGRTLTAETIAGQNESGVMYTTYTFSRDGLEQRVNGELFGVASHREHVRQSRTGLIEQYDGGVLILENIELAPKRVRRRISRFIETGDFKRVYGRKLRTSRVKLVITGHTQIIGNGEVHEDPSAVSAEVAERLKGRQVRLPQLSERIGDIPDLVRHFTERNTRTIGLASLELSPSAIRALMSHDWPGNVGELARVIKNLQAAHAYGRVSAQTVGHMLDQRPNDATASESDSSERVWILQALRKHGFRRARAAAELGISRKTLYNKIKRHRILG